MKAKFTIEGSCEDYDRKAPLGAILFYNNAHDRHEADCDSIEAFENNVLDENGKLILEVEQLKAERDHLKERLAEAEEGKMKTTFTVEGSCEDYDRLEQLKAKRDRLKGRLAEAEESLAELERQREALDTVLKRLFKDDGMGQARSLIINTQFQLNNLEAVLPPSSPHASMYLEKVRKALTSVLEILHRTSVLEILYRD